MERRERVIPNHVAIIMDGNGRWASAKGKTRSEGHSEGSKNLRPVIERFFKSGVSYLTLYAFSTENWKRPKIEIDNLFSLLTNSLNDQLDSINRLGIKLMFLGEREKLPRTLKQKINEGEKITHNNTKGTLSIALNYGSRAEIVNATKMIVREYNCPSEINAEIVSNRLYTADIPDVDLLIRTGGEKRLSNFLLWQSVDAKFMTTETLWPDFRSEHVEALLESYEKLAL